MGLNISLILKKQRYQQILSLLVFLTYTDFQINEML